MLEQWLRPMSVPEFTRTCFRQRVHAAPGTAAAVVPALDWDVLGEVLAVADPAHVLVVAKGVQLDRRRPRDLSEVRALFSEGIGCVVRQGARYHPQLAQIARQFARTLPGQIDLHIFATPAGTHGFGWHYDIEDVFIVQTAGAKDYYFRANTTRGDLPRDAPPDLGRFPRETSPIATAQLLPGDWLYLPSCFWHVAMCREDSLSLSLGLRPARAELAEPLVTSP
jgi:50S ribosomal protein L16 3-hydroxylase